MCYQFSLFTSSFAIKTKPRVNNCRFCHVYGHTISFKIIEDVSRRIFWLQLTGMIDSHIGFWDLHWKVPCLEQLIYWDVSLAKIHLFIRKHIHLFIHLKVNIVNRWWIATERWKIIILTFYCFAWPTLLKWHQGGHISPNCNLYLNLL